METDGKSKKDIIKELAIHGEFQKIRELFGEKTLKENVAKYIGKRSAKWAETYKARLKAEQEAAEEEDDDEDDEEEEEGEDEQEQRDAEAEGAEDAEGPGSPDQKHTVKQSAVETTKAAEVGKRPALHGATKPKLGTQLLPLASISVNADAKGSSKTPPPSEKKVKFPPSTQGVDAETKKRPRPDKSGTPASKKAKADTKATGKLKEVSALKKQLLKKQRALQQPTVSTSKGSSAKPDKDGFLPEPDLGAVPKERSAMDLSPFLISAGDDAVFVVPAYLDFITAHRKLLMRALKLDAAKLDAHAETIMEVASAHPDEGEARAGELPVRVLAAARVEGSLKSLRVRVRREDRKEATIYYLPPDAPEMVSSAFAIRSAHFDKVARRELRPGMGVRAQFAASADGKEGEWHECRVYAVSRGLPKFPDASYKSVRVVWYDQDYGGKWFMSFFQCDNELSPWELQESPKVVRQLSESEEFGRWSAKSTEKDVLSFIARQEAAKAFKSLVSKAQCPRYYDVIAEPVSLQEIRLRLHRDGAFDGGWEKLWEMLGRMVRNAKAFNQPERVEWRMADMLEVQVARVRELVTAAKQAEATASGGAASPAASAGTPAEAEGGDESEESTRSEEAGAGAQSVARAATGAGAEQQSDTGSSPAEDANGAEGGASNAREGDKGSTSLLKGKEAVERLASEKKHRVESCVAREEDCESGGATPSPSRESSASGVGGAGTASKVTKGDSPSPSAAIEA